MPNSLGGRILRQLVYQTKLWARKTKKNSFWPAMPVGRLVVWGEIWGCWMELICYPPNIYLTIGRANKTLLKRSQEAEWSQVSVSDRETHGPCQVPLLPNFICPPRPNVVIVANRDASLDCCRQHYLPSSQTKCCQCCQCYPTLSAGSYQTKCCESGSRKEFCQTAIWFRRRQATSRKKIWHTGW